jgi:hypothetical protein
MRLTARRLNRATLARQLLLGREPLEVAEGVRRSVVLQAQEAASPYLALWNRLAPFDPAGLDAAFAAHAVIKATLMRITLHAVTAADYPPFHRAMAESLRASRLYDRRYRQTGLSDADANALIPHLVEFTAERRTNAGLRRPRPRHPAGVPHAGHPAERQRPAHPAGRRPRRRGVAAGLRRHRGDGVPRATRTGLAGARRRGPRAGIVPGRARSRGLPPLRALVERTPGRRGPRAARLGRRVSAAGRLR